MNYLLRRSLALGGVEALMRIPLVLATGFLARRLGSLDYGYWAVVLAFQSIVFSLASLGFSSALGRYASSASPPAALGMLLFSLGSCLTALVLLAVPILTYSHGLAVLLNVPPAVSTLIGAGLLFVLGQVIDSLLDAYFKARELIVRQAIFQFLRTGIDVAVIVVIFSHISPDIRETHMQAMVVYVAIASATKVVLYPMLLLWTGHGVKVPDSLIRRNMFHIGLPLIPAGLFLALLYQEDRIILSHVLDNAVVGIYGLAAALAAYLHSVGNIAYAMLLPRLSRFHDKGLRDEVAILMDRSQILFLDLMAPVLIFLALLGNEVVTLLAGASFLPAAPLLLILGLAVAIDRLFGAYSTVFYLVRRSNWLMWLNGLYCITVAIGVSVGVHLGGAVGAAWGVVAMTILNNFLRFYACRFFAPLAPSLSLWRATGLAIIAIAVAAALAPHLALPVRLLLASFALLHAVRAVLKLRHDDVFVHKAA